MKKSAALAQIGAMDGVKRLQTIIDIILSIDNFKSDTLQKLKQATEYEGEDLVPLSEIYVDMTYQRKLKVQALINRLVKSGGFDKAVAGHIDLAVRPDGREFVWDGFHRCIKAGISGLKYIKASMYNHDINLTEQECRIKEARMFKIRNADQTTMSPDEIFRAKVVFNDEIALEQLALLKRCKLDVGGTNLDEDAYDLGGFGMFDKNWKNVEDRFLIDASAIIRKAFPNVKNMSVNLLLGFAALLDVNEKDSTVHPASITSIGDEFTKIAENGEYNQNDFIKPVIAGQKIESVARNILRMGIEKLYNDNGKEVKSLIKTLGIEDEDIFEDV